MQLQEPEHNRNLEVVSVITRNDPVSDDCKDPEKDSIVVLEVVLSNGQRMKQVRYRKRERAAALKAGRGGGILHHIVVEPAELSPEASVECPQTEIELYNLPNRGQWFIQRHFDDDDPTLSIRPEKLNRRPIHFPDDDPDFNITEHYARVENQNGSGWETVDDPFPDDISDPPFSDDGY